jgi:UDP-2,4-diacetamido-2,4,6-trideoxy-beta-L-altropyranose hydrolase
MKVLFRVDSSWIIGTGHLVRCLNLANFLRTHGAECQFVCRYLKGNSIQKLFDEGFEVKVLSEVEPSGLKDEDQHQIAHAAWLGVDWQVDAEQTIALMESTIFDWIVVDHYALDICWESMLSPYCAKLMVVDDLADRRHKCDLVLDQNLVENMGARYKDLIPDHCTRLLGPEYALLQPEYAALHQYLLPRSGKIRRIFVFFGGADIHNWTGRTIDVLASQNLGDIFIDVVISRDHQHGDEIREIGKQHANIAIHAALPSLAELMVKADLAIGAGGVTTWERCCLGLPTLVVTLAENQKPIALELSRRCLVRWIGHHDQVDDNCLKDAIFDCLRHDNLRDWSERCLAVVDGAGCKRVTSLIMLNRHAKLVARLAIADDESLLLRWANDPFVRQNAFNSDAILPEDHHLWFFQKLQNHEACRIFIVETSEGIPIGIVRFEFNGCDWEIHYALDQCARFRGVGHNLLNTAIKQFQKDYVKANLFARVKKENLPSQKVFEKMGFKKEETGSLITYKLND